MNDNKYKVVWIVDDDDAIRSMLQTVLETEGYQTRSFSQRDEFLPNIKDQEPDLVLLDILLGEDNGLDICREIKTNSTIPVVLISGSECTDEEVRTSMADGYIRKPFDIATIVSTTSLLTKVSKSF